MKSDAVNGAPPRTTAPLGTIRQVRLPAPLRQAVTSASTGAVFR